MHDVMRVLVVGEVAGVVDSLRPLASAEPPVHVIGPVDVSSLPAVLDHTPADLILLDAHEDEVAGALERLGAWSQRVRTLVIGLPDPNLVALTLAAGGCGVVPPGLDTEAMGLVLLRASVGELILEDGDLHALVRRIADARGEPVKARSLTTREVEVLQALARGDSTTEIAEVLGITPMTVQSHVKHVLAKLGVHSKVEAVRLAWREGLASVPV
jgi:two-component system, NarL family, response regulator LiaR